MICPKCGHETPGNICSNCGALLNRGGPSSAKKNTDRQDIKGRRTRAWAPDHETSGIETGGGDWGALDQAEPWLGEQQGGGKPWTGDRQDGREPWSGEERSTDKSAYEHNRNRTEKPKKDAKKDTSRKASGKDSGRKASSKDSGNSGPGKKEVRLEQREKKLRDSRMRDLENEVERLKTQERLRERRQREDGENEDSDSGSSLGELAARGAAGAILLISRILQIISCLLMGSMVLIMFRSFLSHGTELGNIRYLVAERNYGLALYIGAAAASLFMGVIWCLWILSKKGAGGGFRLKKYDTGRGLIPFLLCAAVVAAAGPAITMLQPSGIAEEWQEIAAGGRAALTAIHVHRSALLSCSCMGAVLSLIRRILLV